MDPNEDQKYTCSASSLNMSQTLPTIEAMFCNGSEMPGIFPFPLAQLFTFLNLIH